MSISLGSTNFGSVYLGSTKIGAAYLGNVKVYSSLPPPSFTVIGGKTYPTVTLPDGREWLALNLDYAWTGLPVPTSGASSTTSPQAVYYDYDESTYGWNGLQRGLLYNHYAVSELEANKASLCPGWHVPTNNEFTALKDALGGFDYGYKLKSTTGWANDGNGTDNYGFNGMPSGYFGGSFMNITAKLYLWSQTIEPDPYAWGRVLSASNQSIDYLSAIRENQYSVRLIRDI